MTQAAKLFTDSELIGFSQSVGGLVFATYRFPAMDAAESLKIADQIASGQTLGFVPDDKSEYKNFLARVVSIESKDSVAEATIAFPSALFGTDMAGLLTVVFGKISFSNGIMLTDLSADARYLAKIFGSRFGLQGIRKLVSGANDRPMLMAILKPGIGHDDVKLAKQYAELVEAGVQIVKDDEVRIDLSLDDAKKRLGHVLERGRSKGLYVTALNGPAFELKQRAVALQAEGAQAFLVCPFTYGLSVLQSLCQDEDISVPIFAHPAFTGAMYSNGHGIDYSVSLGVLMRWCGADAVLYPSPYGSIALPREKALKIHQHLLESQSNLKVCASVPSAGIVPAFVQKIRDDFGGDVVINAGTGIAKSEASISLGVKKFIDAIDAAFV